MSTDSEQRNLNPGSDAARDHGCVCPVLDNRRGAGAYNHVGWYINPECPLHGLNRMAEQ